MANESSGKQYSFGYGNVGNLFSERSISDEGGFFLPHLKTGMRILDAGCGSGSMTIGIAEIVSPGEVIGIDIGEAAINHAKELAKEGNVSNVRFELGNANDIPYENETFDAVLSHNVLEHLEDPMGALNEMYRVLKPSGVIGVSSIDEDGALVSHPDAPVWQMSNIGKRVWRHNGGNPDIGKRLGILLSERGFTGVICKARINTWGTREEIENRAEQLRIGAMTRMLNTAAELGWAESVSREHISDLWYEFAAMPGAFFSTTWCQVVGWKE